MRSGIARGLAVGLALASGGCGFTLAQTAKVQPRGTTTFHAAAGALRSQTDEDRGGADQANLTADVGARVGVAERVDVGLGGFLGLGGQVDAKWSLLDQGRREAIALRGGLGMGVNPGKETITDLAGNLGVLASYEVTRLWSPYLGVLWTNHWIFGNQPSDPLPVGVTYAPRKGYGDGILEVHVGFAFVSGPRQRGAYFEYALWLPTQNDPGDGYRFARSHFLSVAMRL